MKEQTCKLCSKENHPIRLCPQFLQMSINERMTCIKQQKLCLNCFARGHQLRECTSTHSCFTCRGRHHTLLHRGPPPSPTTVPSAQSTPNTNNIQSTSLSHTSSSAVLNHFASNAQGVLLGTALINVCYLGTCYKARALIDSGSEGTFITERLFNMVKMSFQSIQAQVSGLNQSVSAQSRKLCQFTISSPSKPRLQVETTAFVLPQLTGNLPSFTIPQEALRDLPNFELADPSFNKSSQIDVLIGADILPSILLGGSQKNICGSLLGQETVFGWILSGPVLSSTPKTLPSFST